VTTIKPRLWHSMRQPVSEWVRRRGTIEKLAAEYGYTVRILNHGKHWEFKSAGCLIEWWPSTGTLMIDKTAAAAAHYRAILKASKYTQG